MRLQELASHSVKPEWVPIIIPVWTNWTSKQSRGRLIDRQQDDSYGGQVGNGGVEQKGKKNHGHGQQYGVCSGGGGYKGVKMAMKKIQ